MQLVCWPVFQRFIRAYWEINCERAWNGLGRGENSFGAANSVWIGNCFWFAIWTALQRMRRMAFGQDSEGWNRLSLLEETGQVSTSTWRCSMHSGLVGSGLRRETLSEDFVLPVPEGRIQILKIDPVLTQRWWPKSDFWFLLGSLNFTFLGFWRPVC